MDLAAPGVCFGVDIGVGVAGGETGVGTIGPLVGEPIGDGVGSTVPVGAAVAVSVGTAVEEDVGAGVGVLVGKMVGATVGTMVGLLVGGGGATPKLKAPSCVAVNSSVETAAEFLIFESVVELAPSETNVMCASPGAFTRNEISASVAREPLYVPPVPTLEI